LYYRLPIKDPKLSIYLYRFFNQLRAVFFIIAYTTCEHASCDKTHIETGPGHQFTKQNLVVGTYPHCIVEFFRFKNISPVENSLMARNSWATNQPFAIQSNPGLRV